MGQRGAVLRPADGDLDLDQIVEANHANPPTTRYSTSRSLLRIVSGSNAAKSLDGIGQIGGALDPFLQAQFEEAIEQALIDRIVLIVALRDHASSVAHDQREGEPPIFIRSLTTPIADVVVPARMLVRWHSQDDCAKRYGVYVAASSSTDS